MNKVRIRILFLMGLIIFYVATCSWASIVLKTVVVNPSKTRTQKAMLKAYLPKEVTPEDIIDMEDMKIDYDITKSLYFVYKQVELAPGESAMRAVEIEDVWVISKTDVNELINQIKDLVDKLKNTTYGEIAGSLQINVEKDAQKILKKQDEAMDAVPQTHIAAYRENVKRLNNIKANLADLNEMALKLKLSKAAGEGVPASGRISVKATWRLIFAVIVILALLSFVFFIIWHRQAGLGNVDESEEKELKTETTPPPASPEQKT